jgi:outer membrane immunogenic protein
MNSLLRSLAALALAIIVHPAGAADLGMPGQAPAFAPSPHWRGSFIGVQGGYAFGSDPVEFTAATGVLAPGLGGSIPFSAAGDPSGFVIGARWGTNWQSGPWVYGFLSDFSFSDVRAAETVTLSAAPLGTRTTNVEQQLNWFGTTRVRGGYLVNDSLLLYGSGGLASGTGKVTASNVVPGAACVPGALTCLFGSDSENLWGWTAGAGAEYQIGHWSLSLDYIHYDLGRKDLTLLDPGSSAFLTTSTRFSGDMVRGAINYRFDWTFFDVLTGAVRP